MANSCVSIVHNPLIENYNKLVALVTMGQYHFISRDDVIDIFKEVLNTDVGKHIALYIAHPIHEYIKPICLNYQNVCCLRVTWSDFAFLKPRISVKAFIEKYGYNKYMQMRMQDIMVMNHSFKIYTKPYLARPYLPVNMESRKIDISGEASQNGVKTSMSWTKKKMINHYYKSIV
tara:strand:+ start:87 stop:611 length:525 start_codon:yes stop_codon:yes gene_type:complete